MGLLFTTSSQVSCAVCRVDVPLILTEGKKEGRKGGRVEGGSGGIDWRLGRLVR